MDVDQLQRFLSGLHLQPPLLPASHQIREIQAQDKPASARDFYQAYGDAPLLIRGHLTITDSLFNIDPKALRAALDDAPITCVHGDTYEHAQLPATQLLDSSSALHGQYSVYDHPVSRSPWVGRFQPPAYFKDSWWDMLGKPERLEKASR